MIESARENGRLNDSLVRQRLGEAYMEQRVLGLLQEEILLTRFGRNSFR